MDGFLEQRPILKAFNFKVLKEPETCLPRKIDKSRTILMLSCDYSNHGKAWSSIHNKILYFLS